MMLPLEGLKIITAHEMLRVEGMAYAEGASEQAFMENAGRAIAQAVIDFLEAHHLPKMVTLLVGKGNNGGDAYVAGAKLIESGVTVNAYHIYSLESCGPLCKAMYERFCSHGGTVHFVHDEKTFHFEPQGVILDGLVGTGFRGQSEGVLALAIESANRSNLPIIAIDIPSGVDGNTGNVATVAIDAEETIFLGSPKSGFFLRNGWDHVGKLRYVNFGLRENYLADAKAAAYLVNEEAISQILPPMTRTRHKYQAGYVVAIAGSPGMPGAAILASYAALRSGAGIVRLFHPCGMQAELNSAPYELIREEWDGKDSSRILEESKRAKALLVGPGMGRTKMAKGMLHTAITYLDLPTVLDADALFFLSEHPDWKLPTTTILTPHRREMDLLLGAPIPGKEEINYLELCQAFVEEKKVTVVLKGAPTFIFHPQTSPLCMTRGDPGMATAGTGDVLTGMIAAMLAQGLPARHAATVAVYLHAVAGETAAQELTSYCVTASDLFDFIPDAFHTVSICSLATL